MSVECVNYCDSIKESLLLSLYFHLSLSCQARTFNTDWTAGRTWPKVMSALPTFLDRCLP